MRQVSIDDKYSQQSGRIYLSGPQALVRLPLMQRRRDLAQGCNTAGFISGYRGSPLGTYDLALWQAESHLREHHIHFQPGVNEDLAATAVWGSQQVGSMGEAKYDGVFSMWYGKGPGLDRSGDAIKHGNYAGTSEFGGVLAVCGDDHGARSSTTAHQSDHALIHFGIPILHPSSVQEIIDFGLYGFALSRYSGCWVGFKCVTDTVEGTATISVDSERVDIIKPNDFELPPGGLNLQLGLFPLVAEEKLYQHRHSAAQAFVRANGLDRVALGQISGEKKLGIVTAGKSYLDVMEALSQLGIDQERADQLGVAVYKVGMVWPIEPKNLATFAKSCEELLVVEEKRPVMEDQIARELYGLKDAERPRLVGKCDDYGNTLLSSVGELDPDTILKVIAARIQCFAVDHELTDRLEQLAPSHKLTVGYGGGAGALMRMPSFCAGCPHNTSTHVPEGSRALGGIGCHGMAVWMPERKTEALYQMGGEGAPWIGQAPFVKDKHIFQNLGDGTYFHSGLLAIRATMTAKVNITYKILLNGAISMTGGQPIEGEQFAGEITAPRIAHQVYSEGVKRIALVTEDLSRHSRGDYPNVVSFHHRNDLDAVQKELRECLGVSLIIYEQACAAERRRLRKRGEYPDSDTRLFINTAVCEGCGDCGVQSNCIALEPLETEFGRKRTINQSSCNKDLSCVKGFCPSFVTVKGGRLRKVGQDTRDSEVNFDESLLSNLPEPEVLGQDGPYSMMIAGIGGQGVVTMGALIGMAAHLEDKTCSVLDVTGLAQRNGPVTSHVRISAGADAEQAVRIPQHSADLILGCDLVVAAGAEGLSKMAAGRTAVVYNKYIAPTGQFARNADLDFDSQGMEASLRAAGDESKIFGIDATSLAARIFGNAIGVNLFLIGFAWQQGLIPLSGEALEEAIRLNGVEVAMNLRAFKLGRLAVVKPQYVQSMLSDISGEQVLQFEPKQSLQTLIKNRIQFLTDFQNEAYAARYQKLVECVAEAEQSRVDDCHELTEAVARNYSKLLAYKDEYEVARLYTRPEFLKSLHNQFEGDLKLEFNLAPPLLSKRNGVTGRLKKIKFGGYMMVVFQLLSRMKYLRGTALDVFGFGQHRRMERQLITDYEKLIEELLAGLSDTNHVHAVALARLPSKIRGYDVVKEKSIEMVKGEQDKYLQMFRQAETGSSNEELETLTS